MAYLGKYIRQILSRKEEVILPGFGSLKVVEGQGKKGDDGMIDPPGSVVKFNPEHPKGDGKLAEEYASGESLDFEEARQQVLELVDAIKFKLDKGENYSVDQVGEFSRDNDNKIHFVKDANWVIDPELFGLSSLDLLEIEDEADEEEEVKSDGTVFNKEGRDLENQVIDNKSDIEKKPWERRDKGEGKKKWRLIWIVAAVLVVVLAVILLIPTGEDGSVIFRKDGIVMKNNKVQEDSLENKSSIQQTVTNELREDSLKNKSISDEETTGMSGSDDGIVTNTDPEENHFFIIAGSFKNIQNANDLMETLKGLGYPSEVILTENRLYRVSVKGFPTKDEGEKMLPKIQQEPGLSGAWLMAR